MEIKFSNFNRRRACRGAEAARFDITDEGKTFWFWMSKAEIKKNMIKFPSQKPELQKGLDAYGNRKSHSRIV